MSDENKSNNHRYLMITGLAGIASSIIAKMILHPLDTLKVKLQVERKT